MPCNSGVGTCQSGQCLCSNGCPAYSSPLGACYWLNSFDFGGQSCWVPSPIFAPDMASCQALDCCFGGGCGSEGGCYSWMTSSC
jgi:hypothetical protein